MIIIKIRKKLLLILFVIMLLFTLTGCPLSVKGVAVTKYPDRLIYIAGYDTELDLSGGEITLYFSNGSPRIYRMDEQLYRIVNNIDFSVTGVYVVDVIGVNGNDDKFAIQVVDADYIDNIINIKLE